MRGNLVHSSRNVGRFVLSNHSERAQSQQFSLDTAAADDANRSIRQFAETRQLQHLDNLFKHETTFFLIQTILHNAEFPAVKT